MEGLPLEHMLRALQVLGYLAMHTRQLDMVMSSPEAVQHYRDKIATELQEVQGSHTTF
jgi:pyruvate,water dikinase